MPKFTIEQVKNIPNSVLLKLINRAKKILKTDKTFKDMCEEYDLDTDIIDLIPMRFEDLDVSARTSKGVISFNYKLLCDGDFLKDVHYIIHESQHYLQQVYGDKPTKPKKDEHYLDNDAEIEAFQNQVKFLDDQFGDHTADKYVEKVLDHHDFEGKRRDKKEEELKDKISGGK